MFLKDIKREQEDKTRRKVDKTKHQYMPIKHQYIEDTSSASTSSSISGETESSHKLTDDQYQQETMQERGNNISGMLYQFSVNDDLHH